MHRKPARRLPALDRNGRIVIAARGLRGFAFGLNSVALGLYLAALDLDPTQIGLILSAALAGSLGFTIVVTVLGDRIGRRRLLMAGSALMATAALIPLIGTSPVLLALIAATGMVAVNANESTGLQTIDQALLPQSVPDDGRTAAFAVYNVVAAIGSAVGAMSLGLVPVLASLAGLPSSGPVAYTPAFMIYAVLGVGMVLLHARLDAQAEVGERIQRRLPLERSRGIVARLSTLFAVDSLAGSFTIQSFLAYFLAMRFGAAPAEVGALFFASGVLQSASFPVAAWLARRIGLVNTMVFTHIPSSVFLIGVAFAPGFALAAALLLCRAALASMDVPARQSYTMAAVEPGERTAAAGVTSLARALAQVPGPVLAGTVLVPLGLGVPLVATGILKIAYDLALYRSFRDRPTRAQRPG